MELSNKAQVERFVIAMTKGKLFEELRLLNYQYRIDLHIYCY